MMFQSSTHLLCVVLFIFSQSTTYTNAAVKAECTGLPPTPENSDLQCFTVSCIATCHGSSTFTYGETSLVILCTDGVWLPSDTRYTRIPDCFFTCTPPCNNGGNCQEDNICKCRDGFAGERCDTALFCNADEVFSACSDTCRTSCTAVTNNGTCTPTCKEQCECQPGLLADQFGRCVQPDLCPCRSQDGKIVDPGYQEVQEDENGDSLVCTCTSQQWVCDPVEKGIGGVVGMLHYVTLDRQPMQVEGECARYLLQGSDYTIIVEGINCISTSPTTADCDKSLSISIPQLKVNIYKDKQVTVNGRKIRQLPHQEQGLTIRDGTYLTVELPNGIEIQWDGTFFANIFASEKLYGTTKGLLGVYNGNASDDMTLPDGSLTSDVTVFGNAWKVDSTCVDSKNTARCVNDPELEAEVEYMCDKINDPYFKECTQHAAFQQMCTAEGCAGGSQEGIQRLCDVFTVFSLTQCPEEINNITIVNDTCVLECNGDLEFQWGGNPCTRTCRDLSVPCNNGALVDGCMCKSGFSMDSNGQCIPTDACPCYHEGVEYPEGGTIVRPIDQYTSERCDCVKAVWQCVPLDNSTCGGYGDPHYTSFDGLKFDFMGGQTYYLVKHDTFSIAAQNRKAGYVAMSEYLIIRFEGLKIVLYDNMTVTVGDIQVQLPYVHTSAVITAGYSSVTATLNNGVAVTFEAKLAFSISMPPKFYQKTVGICGAFNFDRSDDNACPKEGEDKGFCWNVLGSSVEDPEAEVNPCDEKPENEAQARLLCDVINGPVFANCTLPKESLFEGCMFDTCLTQDNTSVCPIFAQYAADCANQGVIIDWTQNVSQCAIPCPDGLLYQVCSDSCSRSCKDISANPTCTSVCAEGCSCPPGMTINYDDTCIPVTECPCELNGIMYDSGEVITRGDNSIGWENCTCASAKWQCSEQPPALCSGWGDPHYVTFDGLSFSFQGQCSYYLLQDLDFSIEANNELCNEQACIKSLTIRTGGEVIILHKNYTVTIDDVPVTLPIYLIGYSIRLASSLQTIVVLKNGVQVKWDNINSFTVLAPPSLTYNTKGLCGTYNGNPDDDFTTPDGEIATSPSVFGSSWKTEVSCPDTLEGTHACDLNPDRRLLAQRRCGYLLGPMFSNCHENVTVTSFYDACVFDVCASDEPQTLCQGLASYAQRCGAVGVTIDWRKYLPECEVQCTTGHIYKACTDACSRTCHDLATETCSAPCVEGCNCPDGFTLNDFDVCVPVSQCQCIYDGRYFNNEDVMFRENQGSYQRCTCLDAKWSCENLHDSQCLVIGDSHFSTLDGQTYTFPGTCSYYLLYNDQVKVELKTGACNDLATCTRSVTMNIPNVKVTLGPGLKVTFNSVVVSQFPYVSKGVTVFQPSANFVALSLVSGLEIWWDGKSQTFLDAPAELYNTTKGLCGTFTNDDTDDFVKRDGTTTTSLIDFANSWKTVQSCGDVTQVQHACELFPQYQAAAQQHCALLNGSYFEPCHKVLPVSPVYDFCLQEVCENQGKDVASCPVLSSYERQCSQLEVRLEWRQHISYCDGQCPADQMYQTCGDSCARSCKDLQVMTSCDSKCAEGCNCPQGHALKDGACVSLEQCPCVHQDTEYQFGDHVLMDEQGVIKYCTCEGGRWNCQAEAPRTILHL